MVWLLRAIASCLVLGHSIPGLEAAGLAVSTRLEEPRLNFRLHVFAPPGSVNASFPVIFFVGGFAGDEPVFTYSELLERIAARGFIVVGADNLRTPNYPKQGWNFLDVLRWASDGNLRAMMEGQGLKAQPDVVNRAAVMGHSEGNHVIAQALVYDCSVAKAVVMVDPVDGFDPYRLVKSEDLITPGQKLNFTTPALILDNGLDSTKANPLFPPCDPPAMGTARFFQAMRGPVWNVNATAYGHLDCLNLALARKQFVCASDPTTDKAAYHAVLANTTVLFLEALFARRQDDLALLEDPSHFPVDVTLKQDLKGLQLDEILPGCSNGPVTGPNLVPPLLI